MCCFTIPPKAMCTINGEIQRLIARLRGVWASPHSRVSPQMVSGVAVARTAAKQPGCSCVYLSLPDWRRTMDLCLTI
jgi:hypothetical protein